MTKIHHAAIDGVTLLEITSALNDISPDVMRRRRRAWSGAWSPCLVSLVLVVGGECAMVPGVVLPTRAAGSRTKFESRETCRTRSTCVISCCWFELATANCCANDHVAITVVGALVELIYLRGARSRPEQALRVMAPISTDATEPTAEAGPTIVAGTLTH